MQGQVNRGLEGSRQDAEPHGVGASTPVEGAERPAGTEPPSRPSSAPAEDLGAARLHGHGPAFQGRLQVADGALRFVADPTGSPLLGRADHSLPLQTVREVRQDGPGRLRVIGGQGEALVVSTADAESVVARLRVLVSHAAAGSSVDEPLLDALVTLVLREDGPEVVGRLVLDAHRLRFSPASEADVDHILDVDLLSLGPPELGPGPSFLTELAGRQLRVLGPTAWSLFSIVSALQSGHPTHVGEEPLQLVHEPARAWRGPLWCDGTLVFSAGQIQFLPEEPEKNLLKMSAASIPGSSVGRVLLKGWPRKRVVLVGQDGEQLRLATRDPEATMATALRHLHAAQQAWVAEETESTLARGLLHTWAPVVPLEGEELLLTMLVVRATTAEDLCPGVLVVTRRRVLFLPAAGPGGPAPADEHSISQVTRSHVGEGIWQDAIRFRCDRILHRYLPAGGAPTLRAFWDRCRAPSRIIPVEPRSRSLQALDGAARFARIRQPGALEVEVGPVSLHRRVEGWVLVLPRSQDLELAMGVRLTVELGREDGVVQFDTEVAPQHLTVDELTGPLPLPLREDGICLFVLAPAVVRVFNQRRSFRVPVDLSADARPVDSVQEDPTVELDTPGSIGLRLVDLSTGGCAVHASEDLLEGTRIDLRLPLGGREIHTAARVMRVERPALGQPRYGLCFEHLRQSDADCIHRHVLAQQRAALAS